MKRFFTGAACLLLTAALEIVLLMLLIGLHIVRPTVNGLSVSYAVVVALFFAALINYLTFYLRLELYLRSHNCTVTQSLAKLKAVTSAARIVIVVVDIAAAAIGLVSTMSLKGDPVPLVVTILAALIHTVLVHLLVNFCRPDRCQGM